jgi:excisionase family DNA binding protein
MTALYSFTLSFAPRTRKHHMSTSPDSVLTVKEVADYLRVNQRTVYRLAVEGKLPGFKVGATWRFKRSDIDAWIAAQSNQPRGSDAT